MFNPTQVRIRGIILGENPGNTKKPRSPIPNLASLGEGPRDTPHGLPTGKRQHEPLKVLVLPGVDLSHLLRAHATKLPLDTVVVDAVDPAFPTVHRPIATLVLRGVLVSQRVPDPVCKKHLAGVKWSDFPAIGPKAPAMGFTGLELTFGKFHFTSRLADEQPR
jgi:hypothetical protein